MKKRFKTVVTTAMIAALTASLLTGCGSSTDDTTASALNQRYLRMISQMRLKRSAHTTTVHPMISVQSSVPALPAVPFPL